MLVFKQSPLLLVASVLVVASLAGAQNKNVQTKALSIPVTDLGTSESPITASGNVAFVERISQDSVKTQWNATLQLTNASGKNIVAYEFRIEAAPEYGMGVNEDYQADTFFRPESDFGPGDQKTVTVGYPGWQISKAKAARLRRNASTQFRVLFVEFADGSKFGGSSWAGSLSSARLQAMREMRDALAAYASSGNEGLRGSLAKAATTYSDPQVPRMTTSYVRYVKSTLDSQGPQAAVAQINDFLARAQDRKDIR